jgi:hypothetical protein
VSTGAVAGSQTWIWLVCNRGRTLPWLGLSGTTPTWPGRAPGSLGAAALNDSRSNCAGCRLSRNSIQIHSILTPKFNLVSRRHAVAEPRLRVSQTIKEKRTLASQPLKSADRPSGRPALLGVSLVSIVLQLPTGWRWRLSPKRKDQQGQARVRNLTPCKPHFS